MFRELTRLGGSSAASPGISECREPRPNNPSIKAQFLWANFHKREERGVGTLNYPTTRRPHNENIIYYVLFHHNIGHVDEVHVFIIRSY